MKSFYYNVEDAEFVDPSGEKVSMCVPELFYQERAVWRIFLRDRENGVRDLTGIAAWGAAVDCDHRSGTAPMCRSLAGDIVADAEHGSVTVALDAATAEFLAAVDGSVRRKAYFELYGLDPDGERAIQLEFEIAARMIIDPDPAVSPEVPETLAAKSYVTARIGSAVDSAYAAACAGMSGAMASGGYVTSSGAAAIAAGAVSGAIFSGAEFRTQVGDYLLTCTSSGGLVISGGGVRLQVSSGAVVVDGELRTGGGNVDLGGDVTAINVSAYGVSADGNVTAGGDLGANGNVTGVEFFADGGITANGDVSAGGMYVGERAVVTELVTSTDATTTAVSGGVLSGGTAYVYTQPLTSFGIASITSGCRAYVEFTAGADLNVGLPASCVLFGSSACSSGGHYVVAVNGAWVVVNEGKVLSAGV